MRAAFIAIMVIHGLIHLTGFVKAFRLAPVKQLSQEIPEPEGILWLVAAILFLFAALFFSFPTRWWWLLSLGAIFTSQYLVIRSWKDAKFATIFNVIILLVTLAGMLTWYLNK